MLEKIYHQAIIHGLAMLLKHSISFIKNLGSFDLIVKFRAQQYLLVVYISRVDLLPKPKEGRITVNMQRIINALGLSVV